MSRITQVHRDFCSDINRARHLLELIKHLRGFGASERPSKQGPKEAGWVEAVELWEAAKERRTDLPLISGSLVLYLAGRFEYFARQVVETVAEEMAESIADYGSLPAVLRKELKTRTLQIAENPRRFGFEETQADLFLLNLAQNLEGGESPPSIRINVVSVTDSNLKDRALAELMKRVDLNSFWRDVGKQARVKLFLQTRDDRETTAQAQARLNGIMDQRNQIAHPTASTQFPDPDQVLLMIEYLQVLAEVTAELAQIHLAAFVQAAAAEDTEGE